MQRSLFQALCRDGLIELAPIGSILEDRSEWVRLFALMYRRVATAYSGVPVPALHHYGAQTPRLVSSELDSELVVEEQRAFLDWQAPQRIAH